MCLKTSTDYNDDKSGRKLEECCALYEETQYLIPHLLLGGNAFLFFVFIFSLWIKKIFYIVKV